MLVHEQVRLPGGLEVDAGMATLLDALWALGIRTRASCEGTPSTTSNDEDVSAAYVALPAAEDALVLFDKSLRAASTGEHMARIDVSVRFLARPTPPGVKPFARGRAVILELSPDLTQESGLKGCVRFASDLVDMLEVALRRAALVDDNSRP
jgi:hypothetical protein